MVGQVGGWPDAQEAFGTEYRMQFATIHSGSLYRDCEINCGE
jgi:hypothetical protein